MISGLATTLMKFLHGVQVRLWSCTTPRKSMKIQKMFVLVCGLFCILLIPHHTCIVLIFFSFPDLLVTDKYKNVSLKMKLGKDIWPPMSWSNRYTFLSLVVQHHRLDHGIFQRFDPSVHPEQDGDTNPELA